LFVERELKFRLPRRNAQRAAMQLALDNAVALSTTYFDTSARTLGTRRAALRLRRHGRHWLQAFKCEMGPGARGEWEMPLAGPKLDPARFPREEIGIDLGKLRVRPLFETRFVRRMTTVRLKDAVVEVAFDRGNVIAGARREPIHELEIELKRGAPRAMLRYAQSLVEPLELQLVFESKAQRGYRLADDQTLSPPRKWRAPDLGDSTPGDAFRKLLGAAIEQVGANAPGFLASDDPEYLHQLRIGLRRLRAILVAFRALEPRARPLRRRLRRFTPELGAARDWDVFVESLPPRSALRSAADKERMRARREARAVVASRAFNETLVRALRWLEEAPWQETEASLSAFASASLERLRQKALNTARRMDWQDPRERHALRIRIKRLRYAADAFARTDNALERLQDTFGELNDIAVARRLMKGLPPAPALKEKLEVKERMLIARARREWQAFGKRTPRPLAS
jgi:triphosphatase